MKSRLRIASPNWSKKIWFTLAALLLSFWLTIVWLRHLDPATINQISNGELMFRVLGIPFLTSIITLVVAAVFNAPAKAEPAPAAVFAKPVAPFKAQVVGVQWLNPLVRRDYPTEWQLLWVLGLAKPNKNDEKVRDKPGKFTTVQPIAGLAFNWDGENTAVGFLKNYLASTFKPIGRGYIMDGQYFYTIQPEKSSQWRELHGIHVQFAMPSIPQLPIEQATEIMQDRLDREFVFYRVPKLSTANIPADVHTTAGGASVGFTSLAAAMDYLQAHPDKTAWVLGWDVPDFPKDEQMTENSTLLILAGPTYNTGREPLAWIGRPAVQEATAFDPQQGQSRIAQAWQAAIRGASEQAAVTPDQIGYVIHDAGHGSAASGARLGLLGQALTTTLPELDFTRQTFNTAKLLGDMRAGSAITNIALAIAWSHQKGAPVLVAGTTESERATAVVVTPPARPRLVNHDKEWFRARGEGTAYLPWWGMRKDADWNKYMQGYSY
jgi:hypothetical protein